MRNGSTVLPDAPSISRRTWLRHGSAALAFALAPRLRAQPGHAPSVPPSLDIGGSRSLRAQAAQHGLLAGFALNTGLLRDSVTYRTLVAAQCSIAVAENAMKWAALRPASGQFSFEDADSFVQFCEAHRIKMRGHNLCWHQDLPAWLQATATAENARALLQDHIRTVVGRYNGRMHSWDVVNEAVNVQDGRSDGLRKSLWLRWIGEDYIEAAFRAARAADPHALLTYNEYGIEEETREATEKRAAVLLLLRRLRQRNVPIDAVGIQSHIRAGGVYGAGLSRFIESCRELTLEVIVTEIDVDDRALPADFASRDVGVAAAYLAYLRTVLIEPNVRTVVAWGVGDAQSWLTQHDPRADGWPQRPLLLDAELRPKLAFAAVVDAFRVRSAGTDRLLPSRL